MPQLATTSKKPKQKIEILPHAFYSRRDLDDGGVCSWITTLRAEKAGRLKACRGAGSVLYKGSDLIVWLEGGAR